MPAKTASGVDYKSNGSARSHDHKQGNQDRKYTKEQKAEVIRVRICSPTAFYDILGLENVKKTVTDAEIKKAYRRISLLTHPDKNGYEHADEAFKMVSRAFGVLGDKEKRANYDRYGGDPDSRFGGQQASNPFSGFSGRGTPGSRPREYNDEISPEEMFRRFFGTNYMEGGFLGGLGRLSNPQFIFEMGGVPSIRVHRHGGATPRRPRDTNTQREQSSMIHQTILNLLPLILIFILPFLASIISGFSSSASYPTVNFHHPIDPYTEHRRTHRFGLNYYSKPSDIQGLTKSQLDALDKNVEIHYINGLKMDCQQEELDRQELLNKARGWIFTDEQKLKEVDRLPMLACKKLEQLGQRKNF